MPDRSYYRESAPRFSLTRAGDLPIRRAQLGALHAIGAHFALTDKPAIVALPTGVGKTVVGAAAPFVVPHANRVLYIVPSKVLRQDTVANLTTQVQLRAVALVGDGIGNPDVIDVSSRPSDWSSLEACDAAVALPNALFELIEAVPPPSDLFDLIVFDEAHHVPARTWDLVARSFDARQVLLTATPYRRDAQELPGEVVFNYPLSRAIADGAYVPIELVGVETIGMSDESRDRTIASRSIELLNGTDHLGTTSKLLVRAASKQRADALGELYRELGLTVYVVHSGLTPRTVERRIAGVRAGDVDGVVFVGVLGEGFDCPQLKVGAYHDKHKSLPVTLQFLGRLSRVCGDAGPPQVVAAVETLRGDTWSLWQRDSDWSAIVPKLSESATEDVTRRKQLLAEMEEFPLEEVALSDIVIRPSFGLYEVHADVPLEDDPDDPIAEFGLDRTGVELTGLMTGGRFGGGAIIWSHLNEEEQFLVFVTSHVERPDWLKSRALDTERFAMHVVLVRKESRGPPVVAVSSSTRKCETEIMKLLTGAPEHYRLVSPDFMRRFLTVAQISNIQHLGTRNSAGLGQARSYTTNTGKAVEDGLVYDDLRDDVVGHVGAQCHIEGKDYNGGVSITNSRLWVIKRFPIDRYIDFVSDLLKQMGAGQPGDIRRLSARFEQALRSWPMSADPIAVALDSHFLTDVGDIGGIAPVDLDFRAHPPVEELLPLEIPALGWSARLRTNGTFAQVSSTAVASTSNGEADLEELLLQHPPTIFFRDGTSTRGQRLVPASDRTARPPLDEILDTTWDWRETNIRHETPRKGRTDSIHEKVESELRRTHREAWLIGDDGSGEIADHILIELFDTEHMYLHLFHSKASSEHFPGVRTRDLDELVAQIVRSKYWIGLADRSFWNSLASRILNRPSTRVVHAPKGKSRDDLIDACRNWCDRPPIVTARYVGVQPGLDGTRLLAEYGEDPARHARLAETIGACAAWVGGPYSTLTIIGSSTTQR